MAQDSRLPSDEKSSGPVSQIDPSLEDLRQILFGQQVARLEEELGDLDRRVSDRDALIAIITPVLGDAIRRKIRDSRDEMVEALYPIIGQLVLRAVSEAIRDLARTVDAQVRTSFDPRVIWRRLQARAGGVSSAEMALRESLPFTVAEVFLIHRETGLLLLHASRDPAASPDPDLISGMLTAIRNFVQESFGRGEEGQLDEIQYGERSILIEAAQHAYLAVVADGIEPPGFRAEMRGRIIEIEHAHAKTLRDYQGDPSSLASVESSLNSLITAAQPSMVSPTQRWVLVGAAGIATLCLVGACLAGGWAWRAIRGPGFVPSPVAVEPTSTPSSTPTPSPTFTPTFTPMPTPTATSTPLPTLAPSPTATPTSTTTPSPTLAPTAMPTAAPLIGLMTGNVWLREKPSADSRRLGVTLERGQAVEILAAFGDWYRVRWATQAEAEMVGWVPARWVGTTEPIPARIITPTPGS